jgi:hypothetical protein
MHHKWCNAHGKPDMNKPTEADYVALTERLFPRDRAFFWVVVPKTYVKPAEPADGA